MRLLLCLAEHAGEVVSIDGLLDHAWAGVIVAPDSVYQAVASLRRLLGDDPKEPTYIETVPRLGYRMVAKVGADQTIEKAGSSRAVDTEHPVRVAAKIDTRTPRRPLSAGLLWAGGSIFCIVVVATFLLYGNLGSHHSASPALAQEPQNSVAVLPFLDLTEEMNEEPFADGMTEELIDKLSKIPGLRVPSATASFYFKGKLWPRSHGNPQVTIADIARLLVVAYVMDGSVRKSGDRLRVAARLVRADNGYVVWSETYDRRFDDILMVQDEIAGKVASALRRSIAAPRNP
jgi:TolB-like protein